MMNDNGRLLKCGRCGEELKTIKATGNYLNHKFSAELKGCKNCGLAYVPEDLVKTKIAQIEALLESK